MTTITQLSIYELSHYFKVKELYVQYHLCTDLFYNISNKNI